MDLGGANAIVIPGVGHFDATAAIKDSERSIIGQCVREGVPVLGICLGMQWLFEGSEEAPNVPGLGVLPGLCTRLTGEVKVPHVGWNTIDRTGRPTRLLKGLPLNSSTYFTHSYAAPITDAAVARTTHGITFASVVETGRVFGTQFHPEKSGAVGIQILSSFVAIAREANVRC
jgi:glutamine amidotransferase